jgi:DUF2934 family protein
MKNQITPLSSSPPLPSHEEIAQLAYSFYEQSGYQHGHDWEDWFRAEHALSSVVPDLTFPFSNAASNERFRARLEEY